MGYSGGTTRNPGYYSLGDHTETIELDYDPGRISYELLLDIFWRSHDPAIRAHARQYMTAVFYRDEEQKRLALETRERISSALGRQVVTEVVPATEFYLAEGYHQKYRLRGVPEILAEYANFYPQLREFVNSTAVARVNGYLGGWGTREQLENEVDTLGLSDGGVRRLRAIVSRRRPSGLF